MANIEENAEGGYTVSWTNLIGEFFTGSLIEMDNGTAIVELSDGTIKAVNI